MLSIHRKYLIHHFLWWKKKAGFFKFPNISNVTNKLVFDIKRHRSSASSTRDNDNRFSDDKLDFSPKRVAMVVKMTRFEYENRVNAFCSQEELKKMLISKGSDYDGLLQRHIMHHDTMRQMKKGFEARGIEVEMVERQNYNNEVINWADAIFSAGGDGTYLLAASKVKNQSKPVIGINTDPVRSEGYLCLSKYYSRNFKEALDKLLAGKFKWLFRQRIRIKVSGAHENDEPVELYEQELYNPENRFVEHVRENEETSKVAASKKVRETRILPVLALNEVFMGESLSARVSYNEISVDDCPPEKQKSSGVTVCTGTGSTSWFFNINLIPETSIEEILKIANRLTKCEIPHDNLNFRRTVAQQFNESLRFDPSAGHMAYTIRDPVVNGIFQVSNPRGFANKIVIKSRMWDAKLVVDGGLSFCFNDGAVATLEIFESDALRTVTLDGKG
ncbi:NAD kinase 2, mitochondrial-like isoform X1 [Tubulanus polymorphus]|uniref:NAD kinase 2, mitochondrial-like isoform X1 n=1 Tax=Tubulanus polymorphus TaxID=672921 RepID=UPI003DA357B9